MRFKFVTQRAKFIERPNRFLVHATLEGREDPVRIHCPDPGRLRELLRPGVNIHISAESGTLRSTTHTLRFVEHPECGVLISLDTRLTNHLFIEGMRSGFFHQFVGFDRIETEVSLPDRTGPGIRSRIDFRLTNEAGNACWVEVKSATLVEEGVAYFPDAVTTRGRRHLQELQTLVVRGHRAAVVFIVQRPDATALRPQWTRDPMFSQALLDAMAAGVECYACTTNLSLAEASVSRIIPVIPDRFGSPQSAAL